MQMLSSVLRICDFVFRGCGVSGGMKGLVLVRSSASGSPKTPIRLEETTPRRSPGTFEVPRGAL